MKIITPRHDSSTAPSVCTSYPKYLGSQVRALLSTFLKDLDIEPWVDLMAKAIKYAVTFELKAAQWPGIKGPTSMCTLYDDGTTKISSKLRVDLTIVKPAQTSRIIALSYVCVSYNQGQLSSRDGRKGKSYGVKRERSAIFSRAIADLQPYLSAPHVADWDFSHVH